MHTYTQCVLRGTYAARSKSVAEQERRLQKHIFRIVSDGDQGQKRTFNGWFLNLVAMTSEVRAFYYSVNELASDRDVLEQPSIFFPRSAALPPPTTLALFGC